MIKVALKHWIYEACIEQLFNGIMENFIGDRKLKKGITYKCLRFKRESYSVEMHEATVVGYIDLDAVEIYSTEVIAFNNNVKNGSQMFSTTKMREVYLDSVII